MPARRTDALHRRHSLDVSGIVHRRHPVVEEAIGIHIGLAVVRIVVLRDDVGQGVGAAFGDGVAVREVLGLQVLLHPALVADLDGVIDIAIDIGHRGGSRTRKRVACRRRGYQLYRHIETCGLGEVVGDETQGHRVAGRAHRNVVVITRHLGNQVGC